jgi:(4-alkanoyl-5-oxo-2,5-dihydrofuran-3-yl)methyl phosphate reductase
MIVVTGATGTVGSGVAERLVGRGQRVRALSRRRPPAQRPGADAGKVEWFAGDLDDPGTLAGLADGASAVFLVTNGQEGPAQAANLLAEAERAGIGLIVSLSALSAGHGAQDPISGWHREAEAVLQAGPVPRCVLRPGGFMSNTALYWAGSIKYAGTVYAPFGDGRAAIIDPGDISECAVSCLLEPRHAGRTYDLTGPQALSNAEQVEIIGHAIGRDLTYVDVPPDAAKKAMADNGMPPDAADAVLGTLAAANAVFASTVTGDVKAITGRPATSFAEWVTANAAAFR